MTGGGAVCCPAGPSIVAGCTDGAAGPIYTDSYVYWDPATRPVLTTSISDWSTVPGLFSAWDGTMLFYNAFPFPLDNSDPPMTAASFFGPAGWYWISDPIAKTTGDGSDGTDGAGTSNGVTIRYYRIVIYIPCGLIRRGGGGGAVWFAMLGTDSTMPDDPSAMYYFTLTIPGGTTPNIWSYFDSVTSSTTLSAYISITNSTASPFAVDGGVTAAANPITFTLFPGP